MLEIKKGNKKFYVGNSEENSLAEMTFVLSGDSLVIIDHTYVSDELNGKGVGKLLLKDNSFLSICKITNGKEQRIS